MVVEVIVLEDVDAGSHLFSMAFASVISQRFRPNPSKRIQRPVDRRIAIVFDAEFALATVPILRALTLHCAAIAFTRASEAGETDTTARAPRSPKSAYSAGIFSVATLAALAPSCTFAESPSLSKHDSASVTAIPPSLASCAERTAFSLASCTRHSISRFSAARSIAGGAPATIP